jgi:hypothetical protein
MISMFADDRLLTISGELLSAVCAETTNNDKNTKFRKFLNIIVSPLKLLKTPLRFFKKCAALM